MKGIKNISIIILLLVTLIATSSTTYAALADNLIIHQIDPRVNEDGNTYTVDILLSVLDSQQQPIADLNERDFQVSEDGVRVELDAVEVMRDMPINVILVMDVSGSMQGQRLQSAKSAISQFIKSLYRGDKIAIYSFNFISF